MGLETAAIIGAYASVAAGIAGAAISIDSGNKQAKQATLNAQAQAEALADEQARKNLELSENRKRAVVEQRRQRSQLLAEQSETGGLLGSGSELAVLAREIEYQGIQLRDETYLSTLEQRELQYRGTSALAMGANAAANARMQGYGSAISQLGSAAGGFSGLFGGGSKSTSAIGMGSSYVGGKPVSQRPYGV